MSQELHIDSGKAVVICGAGGHAKSVIGVLEALGAWQLAGLLDDNPNLKGTRILGYTVLGDTGHPDAVKDMGVRKAMIAIGDNARRGSVARRMKDAGFELISIVHPGAFIMKDAVIGDGAFLHAQTIIGPQVQLGENVIINAMTTVGHDSRIGDCAHLAPGVHLGGHTQIGDGAFVGMGAVVLPSVRVGRNATIAANSVVTKDIEDHAVAAGMPARVVRRTAPG